MKAVKTIIGVLAILVGIVWILQGTNLLAGSAMSGQMRFAIAGLVALVGGVVILIDTWRKKKE
jgi:uncharacterized membrane protein HdeD (DUF308 family)